ncbi:MAG: hypothetical protein IT249_20005 [Chitinophagaceae bacterium]|nr:hypothetical protein [Chitinophagaceae bacterium]
MKNKLTDLNDHLFAQLERLNEEDIHPDKLKEEMARAKAIAAVATQIVNSSKVTVDAMRLISRGGLRKEDLPKLLSEK